MNLRWLAILGMSCISTVTPPGSLASAIGAEPPSASSPLSPLESLAQFVTEAGLKVELVAHEPSIVDPVAIRFDEDGRMWVVQMRDYPTATAGGPRSRISVLEDGDGDGFFETSTVFADDLAYATGLQPWKGGVFVTLSGKIAYMKDTDGDGMAGVSENWFTGFAEENTQLRASHPRLALDNNIYVANGLRGGTVVSARDPQAIPVPISGMDFRFDPLTGEFDAVAGLGQFGLTFDDYGNRFVCTNRNPAVHVVLEDRDLRKNSLVAVPTVTHDVAKAAEKSRVFPITRSWTTSNLHSGQFTAACGLEIYRGDALSLEFRGNLFVCEPTGHLVHRETVRPLGVTFESTPAREGGEFLASRDPWCSPVNLEVGPDGALYVVDMYRAVIEHPEFMPAELRKRPDLRDGNDRGRIYRVVPHNFRRPPAPRLSQVSNDSLVGLLAHPNAWWRETAARLLLERQDASVGPKLLESAVDRRSSLARIHALWLLEGLGLLSESVLSEMLSCSDPRVVEQSIVAGEPLIARSNELRQVVGQLADHEEARVRFRALLTASSLPAAPQFATDRWLSTAMLIAAGNNGGTVLQQLLQHPAALERHVVNPSQFVADLARLAAATHDHRQWMTAIESLLAHDRFCRPGLTGLFSELARSGTSHESVRATLAPNSQRELDRVFAVARRDAADAKRPESTRIDAIDLLAAAGKADDVLAPLALGERHQPVRLWAIAALAKSADVGPWRQILGAYSRESPTTQSAILNAILASPERTVLLLDEVAAGRIRPAQLDSQQTSRLLQYRDTAIQSRARKLLADAIPQDRQQALAEYQPVLTTKADPVRGRDVFRRQCATCHRIDDIGINIAPDISDSREKSAEQLLTDIIQPNRAIDANYFSYTAVTAEGVVHIGILAAETSTSITLREAEGKSVTLRRDEVDDLSSNGVSLMPEGLERLVPPQDMADLISFIKNWRYLDDSPIMPADTR